MSGSGVLGVTTDNLWLHVNTRRFAIVVLMLGQRRGQWCNIETALGLCFVISGIAGDPPLTNWPPCTYWFNAGLISQIASQHYTKIGWMPRVCWVTANYLQGHAEIFQGNVGDANDTDSVCYIHKCICYNDKIDNFIIIWVFITAPLNLKTMQIYTHVPQCSDS